MAYGELYTIRNFLATRVRGPTKSSDWRRNPVRGSSRQGVTALVAQASEITGFVSPRPATQPWQDAGRAPSGSRISVPLSRARGVAQDKEGRGLPAGCRSFLSRPWTSRDIGAPHGRQQGNGTCYAPPYADDGSVLVESSWRSGRSHPSSPMIRRLSGMGSPNFCYAEYIPDAKVWWP